MLTLINIRHNFSESTIENEKALNEFYSVMKMIVSNI